MLLQEEIDKVKKEIYTDGYPMSIGEMISLYKENEMDIHPEFQRFFRWSILQKSKLIESILLGIPLPSIFVSQREDGVWDVIDGLQRLATIFEFVGILKDENGNVRPASKLVETKYLSSLEGKTWDDTDTSNSLTSAQRLDLKRSKIDVKIIRKESDPSFKYELFQRLNTLGTHLSDQELRNCLLIMVNRDFYEWIRKLANYDQFLNCISLTDTYISKQYHLELVLRFIIFKKTDFKTENIKGYAFLAEYIDKKAIEFAESGIFNKEEEEKIFKDTFDLLNNTLSKDSFKKYIPSKDTFEGSFLISVFEPVAIGIGANIDLWKGITNVETQREKIKEKIIQLWSTQEYTENIGSGRNFNVRIPINVPLGKEIFKP